jgi:CBS domain-containing protein
MTTQGWFDPGVGALIGAGAFLGGCTRIFLMVTVMMVEITGDPTMIVPVGVATLVAVRVGNWFNHGLYHSLIDVASFPFLPDRWPSEMPKALRVEHLFEDDRPEVKSIRLDAQRREIEDVLSSNDYSSFPVLGWNGVVFGVASRLHLQKVLDDAAGTIDVGSCTDFNYATIRACVPLEVAYNLFKRMEVSHMIVVDDNHKPYAMLSRSSLLPWCVAEKIGHARMHQVRSTIQRPRWAGSPAEGMRDPTASGTFTHTGSSRD